jgi:uncharacterized membrane protein
MRTKAWAILLMVLTTALTSTAQIFYKFGAGLLEFNILSLISNYYLISGLALYSVGSVMMITAFKGGELSVLYPIIATSYIWVAFLSMVFFQENLNFYRWMGIFIIFFGVVFIGVGSKRLHRKMEAGVL